MWPGQWHVSASVALLIADYERKSTKYFMLAFLGGYFEGHSYPSSCSSFSRGKYLKLKTKRIWRMHLHLHLHLHVACGWFSSMDLEYLILGELSALAVCQLLSGPLGPPGPPLQWWDLGANCASVLHSWAGKCIARHLLPLLLCPKSQLESVAFVLFIILPSLWPLFFQILLLFPHRPVFWRTAIIIMALLTPLLSGKRFAGGGCRWICRDTDTRYKIQRYKDTKILLQRSHFKCKTIEGD